MTMSRATPLFPDGRTPRRRRALREPRSVPRFAPDRSCGCATKKTGRRKEEKGRKLPIAPPSYSTTDQ